MRAAAGVVADESRVSHVHTRVAGWIERLYINTTGQTVRAGEPLALVFSQDLLSSQSEYLSALRAAASSPDSTVIEAARTRLRTLGMSDSEIARIERTGRARRVVTVVAPRSGTVLHRGVNTGTAVDPSTEIMTVADLSRVWIIAEVPEAGAAQVAVGTPAMLEFPASGRPPFTDRVEFVYPTLTARTRTKRVRFHVENADGRLPPGLYGTARFALSRRDALTVARDAVVDTGETQHVFVRTASGTLEPRQIRAGTHFGERYGLSIRDVQDLVETAIGGMPVSTVVAGRERYSVNIRYAADYRADSQMLRDIVVPVPTIEALAFDEPGPAGSGASPLPPSAVQPSGDMGSMSSADSMRGGGMPQSTGPPARMGGEPPPGDWDLWQTGGAAVPLGVLADVRVVTGPPMIKNENGQLVGYVFADIDTSMRDLGGWVNDAKRLVEARIDLAPGFRLQWTGQYEFMAQMQARLRVMLPLTLTLIIALLYLSLRGWPQTWLVLLSLPFALAGSVWLLALLGYNLSTAVWVGLIAVGGVAAQTGIVVVVYLDRACQEAAQRNALRTGDEVDQAVIQGAAKCLRPMLMTVATTVFGLMPLLWESGIGADLSARTAAPVVGGLWSCMFLTLLVLPAAYAIWRRRQLASGSSPAAQPM